MIKLIILILISNLLMINCCNKSLCGSQVTKCLLTKECKCEEGFNLKCYKECFTCLEDLYQDCCPCFEFCPKLKVSTSNLNEISHVENLDEPKPELFEVLTEDNDRLGRWTSLSFPVEITFETQNSKKKVKFTEGTKVINGNDQIDNFYANCNVAFISKCLSWTKCKSACISMGSSSYRWFHNGCCSCIGSRNCLNYGLEKGQCKECPSKLENLNSELIDNNDNENLYDNQNKNENLNENKMQN